MSLGSLLYCLLYMYHLPNACGLICTLKIYFRTEHYQLYCLLYFEILIGNATGMYFDNIILCYNFT